MKTVYSFVFSLLSLCAVHAQSIWSTDPNTDNNLHARVYNPLTFCTDGHGGAFFTYQQTFTGQTRYIIVNRIDSSGHLRLGDSGIVLKTITTPGDLGAPEICEDGNGGCYVAYENNVAGHPIYIHHLDAGGTNLWADTGMLVTDKFTNQFYQNYYSLINDNNEGVMVAFFSRNGYPGSGGIYGQRFNSSGQRQWGNYGTLIEESEDSRDLRVISDGNRGMAMIWSNYGGGSSSYLLRMQHVNHDGQATFSNGIKRLNQRVFLGITPFARLVLTKNHNYIAVWNQVSVAHDTLYMQKVDSLGNSLWGNLEIKVVDTTGEKLNPDIMSDGEEGAYCLWQDGRKVFVAYGIYAQHINGTGVKQWASQGALIDSNMAGGSFTCPYLTPDINGNIKVFYKGIDFRTHMQILDSNGARQIAGTGTVIGPTTHDLLYYKAVLPVLDNHDILFIKNGGNGDCFAKYVPFTSVLPLTFTMFSVITQPVGNVLNWQTANEINTAYFSVERSLDGVVFTEVGRVKAIHTGSTEHYTFTDALTANGDVYYRIKEIDADGSFTYSKVIRLHLIAASGFHILPNPARSQCVLYFDAAITEPAIIRLFDMSGKICKQFILAKGQATTTLTLSDMASSIYLCQVKAGNKVYMEKLIISK